MKVPSERRTVGCWLMTPLCFVSTALVLAVPRSAQADGQQPQVSAANPALEVTVPPEATPPVSTPAQSGADEDLPPDAPPDEAALEGAQEIVPAEATPESADEASTNDAGEPSEEELLEEELDMGDLLDALDTETKAKAATQTKMSTHEAPAMVTVIGRDKIIARGYRSIGEALGDVPGLYIVDDYATSNVGIRGINGGPDSWSRVVKVLIDGYPATFHSTGGALLGPEFMPIDSVDSIEVIRGPASALYGANAFLGVINVRTRQGTESPRFEIGGVGGVYRDKHPMGGANVFGTATTSGRFPVGVTFGYAESYIDRSGATVPSGSPRAEEFAGQETKKDTSRPRSAHLSISMDRGKLGQFSFHYNHQRLLAGQPFSDVGTLTQTKIAVSNDILRANHDLSLWDNKIRINTYYQITRGMTLPQEVLDVGSDAYTIRRDRKNVSQIGGIKGGWYKDANSAMIGFDLQDTKDDGDSVYQLSSQDSMTAPKGSLTLREAGIHSEIVNVGMYAQGVWYPIPRIGLTAGVRYDINDRWSNRLNARGGVVVKVLEGMFVKALFGTSYVPPAFSQLNGATLRFGGVKSNADLAPQTANTAELGGSYQLPHGLTVRLNGFWTGVKGRVENVREGTFQQAKNLTDSNSFGGEGSIEFEHRLVFAESNFSFQSTEIKSPDPAPASWQVIYDPNGPGGLRPPGFPVWMGNTIAGLNIAPAHLRLVGTLRYVGPRKSSSSNIIENGKAYELDPYVLVGANIQTLDLWPFLGRELRVTLRVTNAINTKYSEAGALGVDIPGVPRSITLHINQEF